MSDYPIEECVEVANKLIAQGSDIYQKWTCRHCGSRQTMGDKNKFFRSGKCEECQKVTIIRECNYMAVGSWTTLGRHLLK